MGSSGFLLQSAKVLLMLRFLSDDVRVPFDRREFLRLGFTGSGIFAARAAQGADTSGRRPRGFGNARSVILVYASGGQSQLDMWDPKPDAPADVRGEFESIATSLAGVRFCEHMPQLSRLSDRFSVVRSMSHEDLDHGTATYLALTGRYHRQRSANPPPSPLDLPTYGAVLKRVRPTHQFPYESVHVNGPALVPQLVSPGQDGGILGRGFEPLVVGDTTQQRGAAGVLFNPAAAPGPNAGAQVAEGDARRLLASAVRTAEGARIDGTLRPGTQNAFHSEIQAGV